MLSSSPIVKSVAVHRSVATGEVDFGVSDIDMLLVIDQEQAARGAAVASLYHAVNRARRLNPPLTHIEVYESGSLTSLARLDTFWASVERRSMMLLRGEPVELPRAPVQPDHALSRFLLWLELFFAASIERRNHRNLRKISLECWNAYASAEGLIAEPYLLRSDMETAAHHVEENLRTNFLEEPSYAAAFVFGLAERLHRSRLPALRKLDQPLVFEALMAPLCLRRRFVVIPRADSPLPPEAFVGGAFTCTPEILDLFAHAKNAFLDWILPPELIELGIRPPLVSEFLHSCRYYGHRRFLLHPGFVDPNRPTHRARLALIHRAMDSIARCELPPVIGTEKIQEIMAAGAPNVADYYRTEYESLRRDSQRIEESLQKLSGSAASL